MKDALEIWCILVLQLNYIVRCFCWNQIVRRTKKRNIAKTVFSWVVFSTNHLNWQQLIMEYMASLYQAQHPVRFSCCATKHFSRTAIPLQPRYYPWFYDTPLCVPSTTLVCDWLGFYQHQPWDRVLVLARTGAREGRGSRGRQEQCSDPVAGLSSWRREGVAPLHLRRATYTNISLKF